ncbi:MAG: YqaE/Pmp3 family membrane protein, partial [Pseudomonas sp.]
MDIIRIIIAILLPPLGVFLQVGFGGAFWLNILLTLCGYFPG